MQRFLQSVREFRRTKTIVVTALFLALYLALESFSYAITPFLPNWLRISFSFLSIGIVGYLFGPAVGAGAGALADILDCIFFPRGAWFPGFTLTALLVGWIFGMWLYQRKASFIRVLMACACITFFCNILLNTLWVSMTSGKAIQVIFWGRLTKNLIALPIESGLLFILLKKVSQLYKKK